MPDPRNFLELNRRQRNAVLAMAGVMRNRRVVWDDDADIIILEAIQFRHDNRMEVFPHLEVEDVEDEPEPPVAPRTPRIHDLRAPE